MVSEPMSQADLLALLPMVEIWSAKAGESWSAKAAIVQAIGTVEGGDWWTAADVARLVGRATARCRELLGQLDDAGVILRDGGGGGRRFWCEVNPEWRAWAVTWRFPKQTVAERLAYARERRSISPLVRFTARARHRRYAGISARLIARDKSLREAVRSELARDPGPRANAGGAAPDRATWLARYGDADRAAMARALIDAIGDPSTLLLGVLTNSLAREGGSEAARETDDDGPWNGHQDGRPERSPEVEKVIAAICSATAGRVYGRLASERVPALVERWGLDRVLEAIRRVDPGGLRPPVFVDAVEQRLAALDQAADDAAERRERAELRELKTRLAAYQASGAVAPDVDVARHAFLCEQLAVPVDLPLPLVADEPPPAPGAELDGDLAARLAAAKSRAESMADAPIRGPQDGAEPPRGL